MRRIQFQLFSEFSLSSHNLQHRSFSVVWTGKANREFVLHYCKWVYYMSKESTCSTWFTDRNEAELAIKDIFIKHIGIFRKLTFEA